MPLILEDNDIVSQGTATVKTIRNYGPKDFNSILTGNGINQGLLRSNVYTFGSENVPNFILSLLVTERYNSTNKAHHVHDDVRTYTTLHQDISLCSGFTLLQNKSRTMAMPKHLFNDHFMTFEDVHGNKKTFRSRLFLNKLYVYKAVNNYVLGNYTLAVIDEANPTDVIFEFYDGLYGAGTQITTTPSNNPIIDMYKNAAEKIQTKMNRTGYMLKIDDSVDLALDESLRSMYDLIMSELEIIKTPGILGDTLKALSACGFDMLDKANSILNLVNIPFMLYQTDVIDVVNARSLDEATRLKNGNMSLSLADTLSAMQGKTTQQIPELAGKHYYTKNAVLTTEQIAAIESPSKITIVAAGAGTGKSTCINHRLTFMEENGCDMSQTFVLSFTKAAAGHIKKLFKDCKSSTIADFTHNFVNVILDDGSGTRVDIISHSDFVQKLRIQADKLVNANILSATTITALQQFIAMVSQIDGYQSNLLDALNINLNPEANNLISILRMMHCSSLELDPIIFHTQLHLIKPNIEHIVIDESQDSNRLEFLTMLKMAMLNDISIYIVGDCAQTLYEFRDADPRILNNLTKLFTTYDLSINHRSTQIILDVANLMSNTMSTHKTTLRSNNVMQITQQAINDTVFMNTYSKVTDPVTLLELDKYLEKHLGNQNGETIAVIARSGQDVQKLFDYLHGKYGTKYNVQNITSQRRNDITILSTIGQSLSNILPDKLNNWKEFEKAITDENIRINSMAKGGNRYNVNGPTVNKVTMEWLAAEQANGVTILNNLNDPAKRDDQIRTLQLSLLDAQTEKNNLLQRVMDAKNAKLKGQKADIVVCTVHGVKGLEYDHVACFITTEAGRNYSSNSDENKRISYVALTRAKQTECVFCTREKLVKDFEAYRAAQPV